jgi:hypothetical protein
MSVTIRNRSAGRDPVARSHRRASVVRTTLIVSALLSVLGGGMWLMFASSVFAVTDVRVEGASVSVNESLRQAVDDVLGQRRLGFLRPARNLLLLNADAVALSLSAAFGNIERLEVRKEYPHTVRISAVERTPIGAWCIGQTCQYFDSTGARWGSAVPSRGPLLLLVQDERSDATWDPRLFSGLSLAVNGLPTFGLRPITVTFPDAAPGDMTVTVGAGYSVLMDALGDVQDQLSTLEVLVADKAKDQAFRPQYIDVRTPGRVYYK